MAKRRATGKPKQSDLSSEEFIARQIAVFRKHENTLSSGSYLNTHAERKEFRVASRYIQDYYKNNPNSKSIQNFLNRSNRFSYTRELGAGAQGLGRGQGGRGAGGGGSILRGK